MLDIAVILPAVGVLTVITNVITQVLKGTIKGLPAQITATITALAVTLIAFFAYVCANGLPVLWYEVAAAVVCGFFVSFAAQFGYDKLCEVISKYKGGAI